MGRYFAVDGEIRSWTSAAVAWGGARLGRPTNNPEARWRCPCPPPPSLRPEAPRVPLDNCGTPSSVRAVRAVVDGREEAGLLPPPAAPIVHLPSRRVVWCAACIRTGMYWVILYICTYVQYSMYRLIVPVPALVLHGRGVTRRVARQRRACMYMSMAAPLLRRRQ